MAKFEEVLTPGLTIRESANDGSDFTNPGADYRRLFLGEDGQLHVKDSAGTVTDIGGGSVAAGDVSITDSGGHFTGTDVEAALQELGADQGAITTFTPTWVGSGSNPTLGNGTITGHYQKVADKLYWFCIVLTYGSTSAAGTGFYSFGDLPFTVRTTSPVEQVVSAQVRDSGTTRFTASAILAAAGTAVTQVIVGDATGSRQFSGTVPITLATGDTCIIEGIVATD